MSASSRDASTGSQCARLNIAHVQSAVGRDTLVQRYSPDPLAALMKLYDAVQGIRESESRGLKNTPFLESALGKAYLASLWLAEEYGIALRPAYRRAGLRPSITDMEDRNLQQTQSGKPRSRLESAADIEVLAQQIARLVGHFEIGLDEPDDSEGLADLLTAFHRHLLLLAAIGDVDLPSLIRDQCQNQPGGGASLSRRGWLSPQQARSVRQFAPVISGTHCPFAPAAQLWGLDPSPNESIDDLARRLGNELARLVRVSSREALDGLVVAFPADRFCTTVETAGVTLQRLLARLLLADPLEPRSWEHESIRDRSWRFRFNGEDFFVPIFAPFYPPNHPRFTYSARETAFVLFQPNVSFHRHLGASKITRAVIRTQFADGLQEYEDRGYHLEAHRFLPGLSGQAVDWFDTPSPFPAASEMPIQSGDGTR